MATLISIVLFILGAIIFFAVEGDVRGVDAVTLGVILMAAGAAGVLASLVVGAKTTSTPSLGEDAERDRLIPAAAEEWPDPSSKREAPPPNRPRIR